MPSWWLLTGIVIGKPDMLNLNMPLDVLSLERASCAGFSLVAYFFTGLNNLKLIYLSLFKVMNYILKKKSPLEAKNVSGLLHESSVIGSALQVLEKVPYQSLVSWLRHIDRGWNSVGFTSSFHTMKLFS